MDEFHEFLSYLTGEFDNKEQYEALIKQNEGFPFATHRNTIINDRILGLPQDFSGVFLIEESTYRVKDRVSGNSFLFLFTPSKDGIVLTSYQIPEGYDKANFKAENVTSISYRDLKPNPKFTPTLFEPVEDGFAGSSESMFTPVLKFCLNEHFTKEQLEVQESMFVNGKQTFGFDEPIVYKHIAQ